MKILGIGESVIDKIIITHQDGETTSLEEKHVGGPVVSALILLSRLGTDCTMMTSLGKDADATIVRKILKKEKIHLLSKVQKSTKVHTIFLDPSTGKREKQRGDTTHTPIKNISRAFLQQFDLIIMDRHEKQAFSEILAKKKSSTKLIIDTSTEISDTTLTMLQHSECPILPIEALAKIDSKKDLGKSLKTLQKLCSKPIIVTAGDLGSILFTDGKIEILPALAIKSIDATGAGDIFRGAFAFGVTQNWDIRESVQFANFVAGLQCTKIGNVAAIPTKQEIELCKNLVIQKNNVKLNTVNNYFARLTI